MFSVPVIPHAVRGAAMMFVVVTLVCSGKKENVCHVINVFVTSWVKFEGEIIKLLSCESPYAECMVKQRLVPQYPNALPQWLSILLTVD